MDCCTDLTVHELVPGDINVPLFPPVDSPLVLDYPLGLIVPYQKHGMIHLSCGLARKDTSAVIFPVIRTDSDH